MTLPDREKIRDKLESTGFAEVKKRYDAGSYAKNKMKIVEEWLSEQATVHSPTGEDKEPTQVDKYLTRIKNHPLLAIIIVGAITIGGIAQFTDAISKLVRLVPWSLSTVTLPVMPGDSGWILVGDLDPNAEFYVRGPLYEDEKSSYSETSIVPRKGELIRLLAERNLIIAGYKTDGVNKLFMPPWQLNILSEADYTGIRLHKDSVIEIRDVSLGSFPGQPIVVWVRVAPPPR